MMKNVEKEGMPQVLEQNKEKRITKTVLLDPEYKPIEQFTQCPERQSHMCCVKSKVSGQRCCVIFWRKPNTNDIEHVVMPCPLAYMQTTKGELINHAKPT